MSEIYSGIDGADERIDAGTGGNDGANGSIIIDPNAIETPKRGRGRPAGSGNRNNGTAGNARAGTGTAKSARKEKASSSSVNQPLDPGLLTMTLMGVNNFIAKKNEAMKLDAAEFGVVQTHVANVASYYNVPASPKAQAWLALFGALGTIYGAKMMAAKMNSAGDANG